MPTSSAPPTPDDWIERFHTAWQQQQFDHARGAALGGLQAYPDHVPLLVRAGKALLRDRNYDEAELTLHRALELAPDDYEALYQLGLIQAERGNVYGALAQFDRLVTLYPDDPETLTVLAYAWTLEGHPERALVLLEPLHTAAPETQKFQLGVARALIGLGRFAQARPLLETVISRKPTVQTAWLLLAEANFGLFREDAWMDAAERAFALNPDVPLALVWAARTKLRQGQVGQAQALLNQALTLNPATTEALLDLGQILWWFHQDLEAAQQAFTLAVQNASHHGGAHAALAQFQQRTAGAGGLPDWTALMEEAEVTSKNHRLPFLLGDELLNMGELESGLRMLELWTDAESTDLEALTRLGQAYVMAERFEEADAVLQRALALCGDGQGNKALAPTRDYAAFSALMLGRAEEATQLYEQALPHLEERPLAVFAYGEALRQLGRITEARQAFEEALEQAPQNEDIRARLALLELWEDG
jgi:tetratricopeptide (TPR) repeat protein